MHKSRKEEFLLNNIWLARIPANICYLQQDGTDVKKCVQIMFDCCRIEWERKKQHLSGNICTVCGGIKHGDCFLLTHRTSPRRSCIFFKRLPALLLLLLNLLFSLSACRHERGKKVLHDRSKGRNVCEGLVKMWLCFFYFQHFQFCSSTKDAPREEMCWCSCGLLSIWTDKQPS